jgi:hypothetical protein
MDYHDTLSAGLPPPRDDDPPGVRQDIVDELADHLACAYNRERLRGSDAIEAQKRVIQRFGDPAAVARRLWLDAIGGKIMTQRVLVATCLVVTFASLALAGAMWHLGSQIQRESARATAEAIRAMTLQSEKAQSSQQEMLKQLRAMSEAVQSTRSFDWNPVSFQLTEETPDGPPAVGFQVTLTSQAAEAGKGGLRFTTRVSDRSGIADFGVVHPGQYSYEITKSWDQSTVRTSGFIYSFIVEPGSQTKQKIVCPQTPLQRLPVRVRATWPQDLEKEGLVLYATFVMQPIKGEAVWWNYSEESEPNRFFGTALDPGSGDANAVFRSILYGPGTAIAEVLNGRGPLLWTKPPESNVWADLLTSDVHPIKLSEETMKWVEGTYQLATLYVLRPHESLFGERGRHFELVVSSAPGFLDRRRGGFQKQPVLVVATLAALLTEDDFIQFPNAENNEWTDPPSLQLPDEYWSRIEQAFEARPGRVNEWAIPLPDEFIATIRKSLKTAQ